MRERPLLEIVVVFGVVGALLFGALFFGLSLSVGTSLTLTLLATLALFALVLLAG